MATAQSAASEQVNLSENRGEESGSSAAAPECTHPERQVKRQFWARDPVTGERFWVGTCRACGLDVTSPQPPPSEIERYYPPAYYGGGRRYMAAIEWLLDKMYDQRIKRVVGSRGPGKVLDVGCGRGLLLAKLRDRGWDAHGTELSSDAAYFAKDVLGLTIETRRLEEIGYPDESFDFVIIWHVLEHLHEPRAMLREIERVLKPDGAFLVAVPNFASWEAQWGKRHWFHLNVPGHLIHFTPKSLERELESAGFEVSHRTFFSSEYDFFSFVQTAQNKLGLRFNLLYDLFRKPGARFGSPDKQKDSPLQKALALLLAVPLSAISAVYAPAAALLRKGSTVQLLARKSGKK